jgi:HAD superfamily hydrolase (TIGR01450 family)
MSEVVAAAAGLGNIDAVVFDLDGVVYVDGHGIPGAGPALASLDAAGLALRFATNNSTKSRATAAEHIAVATGYDCRADQVVSSAWVTARHIAGTWESALVVGEEGLATTLRDEGIAVVDDWRSADVVVAGLDRGLTYRSLADAALAISVGGAAFVATNTDATYPTQAGPAPGGGSIVAAIETATGVVPLICGKPHPPFIAALGEVVPGSPVMVGDRPETDMAVARAAGWPSVLVLTGVTDDPSTVDERIRPDHVIPSIAGLPDLLGIATA